MLALNEMSHLSPDQAAAAGRLRDLLDHDTAGAVGGETDRRKSAYERMTLEISFINFSRPFEIDFSIRITIFQMDFR